MDRNAIEIDVGGDGNPHLNPVVSPKEDPLLVDLVLLKLFKFLGLTDLANCRLVSRRWYSESLTAWRSTSTLRFVNGVIRVQRGDGTSYNVSIPEFLQFWERECGRKPHRKFHLLDNWNLMNNLEPSEVTRFWNQIGNHVTTLTLCYHRMDELNAARKLMYQACPYLRNFTVHNLVVVGEGIYYYYGEQPDEIAYRAPEFGEHAHLKSLTVTNCLPDSWLEILSHFSSIESLNFNTGHTCTFWLRKLLEAIHIIKTHDPKKLPLTQFTVPIKLQRNWGDIISYDNFVLLRQLQLPLTHLQIGSPTEINLDQLKHILQESSQTITTLEGEGCSRPLVEFPFGIELPNLQRASLNKNFCKNWHFLKYTPNLQQLDVGFSEEGGHFLFPNTSETEMANVKLRSLKKLSIGFEITEDNLRSLTKWMPNVEDLGLYFDDNKFSIVCETWKNMTTLHDIGEQLTDVGITGIRNQQNAQGEGDGGARANVTDLTKLKSFCSQVGRMFTGMCVMQGFIRLPCFETLFLWSMSPAQIGDEANAALRQKGVKVDQILWRILVNYSAARRNPEKGQVS